MKIGIAADHRGYKTKEQIKDYFKNKYEIIDYGTDSEERVDYPIYGIKLGEKVRDKEVEYGIAICGSAIGISIACNKVKGIRCGKVNSVEEALHAKENDLVNIIALSGENVSIEENMKIVDAYLHAKENTEDERYIARVNQIKEYENNEC